MTKYIFVTGGVVSGLGKGITAASLGRLLKARGLTVAAQKLDPYINVDPGTMSPYQHGEVYDDVYAKVMEHGVMVLPTPTSTQMVAQTLRILCAARERLRRMEEKQATVEEKIEEIRAVNRAKWLLIERLGMTEAEAHRYIEKQAMDLRQPRREVAENIIKTY